jgi:tetratricopeptide (TPR) repeat protein
MSNQVVGRFVRNAWLLLLVQLVAATGAVAVTAWAAFQVRPLLAQRSALTAEIGALNRQRTQLLQQQAQLSQQNDALTARLTRTRQEARVRAADSIRRGINAYHAGDYAGAIAAYDEALGLDPENAYVLDLRSYSQFRANDLDAAIASISAALSADPGYTYGYSELARYACAAGRYDLAAQTYAAAKTRDTAAASLFSSLLRDDGQFSRLCAPARDRFN